jgi:hypothetical protein
VNFINFPAANLHDAVENKARGNTVRNAITEGHKDSREECGDRLIKIAPVNILKR